MALLSKYVTFAVVELRTHRCGCTWTVTEAELEKLGDDDQFRCLHREQNPFRELAVIRMTQEEYARRLQASAQG